MRNRRSMLASSLLVMVLPLLPQTSSAAQGCIFVLTDRCESWAARYDGPAGQTDAAEAVVSSPTGDRIYVGGPRTVGWSAPFSGATHDTDYGIVAYEPGTGRELWVAGYAGPGDPESGSREDFLLDLETSADGSMLFGTGGSRAGRGPFDYDWATIALDADTGRRLWVARHNAGGGAWDTTWDLAVGTARDGEGRAVEMVFVTGYSTLESGPDVASTIAYDAATGTKLWESRIQPGPDLRSIGFMGSGEESVVYVAGSGIVIGYDALTGRELWRSPYGLPDKPSHAWSLAVAGQRVYVTGWGASVFDLNEGISLDGITAAYDGRTGERLWQSVFAGPGDADDFFWEVVASPAGDRVYTTGRSGGLASTAVTAAYSGDTGAELWSAHNGGVTGVNAASDALVVNPEAGEVYVAASVPFTTLAYDAETGRQRWEARYTPPGGYAYRLTLAPDHSRLFVTGGHQDDFLTVAYDL